jgi:hypothetical protein
MASSNGASSLSERLHARRPWWVLLSSLLVFLALDNGIFRSGLYSKVESTKGVAGHLAAVARSRLATQPSGMREVLVLGHSKIEAALSEKIFEQDNPDSKLKLVLASSGGTTEKMWYYLLKHVDPNHNRYAAIVIPIDSYKTPPLGTDCDNLIDVAQFLAPMLSSADWQDLIGTYSDPKVREKVVLGAVVSSHLYALDLQDLLLHPVSRQADLQWSSANGATFLYKWDGYDGDLTTLEIDKVNAKILHAPPHLDAFRRMEAEVRFQKLPLEYVGLWTNRFHEFRKYWIMRMVDLYANSDTKIVFVQVPRWPFDMPTLTPIEGAPDLRDFVKPSKNVVVVDGDEFVDLEKPEYFYDVLHVNKLARREFTVRFAKDLRAALGDLP